METHFERVMVTGYSGGKQVTYTENDVTVTVKKDRNPGHHRKVMGMLQYVLNNIEKRDDLKSVDDLIFWYKDTYNKYTPMNRKDGSIGRKYISLKFSQMNEVEFTPIAEEMKQFCYLILNSKGCSKDVIQGLLDIEF